MSDVPIAWFTAEVAADKLITSASDTPLPVTFQYRAARDVLSLTWLFANIDRQTAELSLASVRRTGRYLQVERRWWIWCNAELSLAPAKLTRDDLSAWSEVVRVTHSGRGT